eukprot:scaffold552_cov526-Prasinococcus_capsulatus_cf.AAC.28
MCSRLAELNAEFSHCRCSTIASSSSSRFRCHPSWLSRVAARRTFSLSPCNSACCRLMSSSSCSLSWRALAKCKVSPCRPPSRGAHSSLERGAASGLRSSPHASCIGDGLRPCSRVCRSVSGAVVGGCTTCLWGGHAERMRGSFTGPRRCRVQGFRPLVAMAAAQALLVAQGHRLEVPGAHVLLADPGCERITPGWVGAGIVRAQAARWRANLWSLCLSLSSSSEMSSRSSAFVAAAALLGRKPCWEDGRVQMSGLATL